MAEKLMTSHSYPDELQSLRVKQMSFIAEDAGFSRPGRVAENAEILHGSSGAVSPDKFLFEPTRHNEGFRRALWTLNTYELSLNQETGLFEPSDHPRKDWEITQEEKRLARIALRSWEKTENSRLLPNVNDDLVAMYTQELRKTPLLSAEEEVELAKQIEAGLYACQKLEGGRANQGRRLTKSERKDYVELALIGKDAFDHFYRANLPLVVSVAKRYSGMSMPLIDIIQEGNLGLWHAIEKFDYKKGYKFSTYATKWINQAITHTLPQQTSGISLTEHVAASLRKLRLAWKDYELETGRTPGIDVLIQKTGLAKKVIEGLQVHIGDPLSIDTPQKIQNMDGRRRLGAKDDFQQKTLIDLIADDEDKEPLNVIIQNDLYDQLWSVLDSLEDNELQVIVGRFGLKDYDVMPLEQLGELLGVRSRNATSKHIQKILDKMKKVIQEKGTLSKENL